MAAAASYEHQYHGENNSEEGSEGVAAIKKK